MVILFAGCVWFPQCIQVRHTEFRLWKQNKEVKLTFFTKRDTIALYLGPFASLQMLILVNEIIRN